MNQSQQQDNRRQAERGLGCLMLLVRALATSVEVFLHQSRTFGERYLGIQTGLAALLIFFYPVFWEGHDVRPLYGFLLAYVFMYMVARVATIARRARGALGEHSYYTGRPRITRFTGRMSEATVKGLLEPLLVCLVGIGIGKLNAPLGGYLLIAALGLAVSVQSMQVAERRRMLELQDAYMEQQRIAEQWRSMRRD